MRPLSRGIWRLRSVFLLPTVIRPAESHKHKVLCFGSGHRLLPRHREGEGRGLKREKGERLGAKREGQERMSASSASSVHLRSLHPSLHPLPPSCASASFPAAGQFLPQQRKTSLMAHTETSVCVQTKNTVSKLSMNSHPPSPRPSLAPFSTLSFSSYNTSLPPSYLP